MAGLTPEFAQDVDLPLNPFARNRVVRGILHDPDMVGGMSIDVRTFRFIPPSGEGVLHSYTTWPLVGRMALKDVAQQLSVQEQPTQI